VPGVGDTQCGFKIMRGDLGRAIFADCRTRGFSFDVEMLARARALGARIEEFPVVWSDVPGSTFSPVRHGLRSFAELVSIQVRLARRVAPTTRVTPLRKPAAASVVAPDVRWNVAGGA
jgi:dolichyl-phosphate beta-glucosyltransferase